MFPTIIKLVSIVAAIVILLRLKINFGAALISGSTILGLLFFEGAVSSRIITTATSFLSGASAPGTLNLLAVLVLVLILGEAFRYTGNADKMVDSLTVVIPDQRIGMVFSSMLIGFLPMLGGAMLSAPMVERFARRLGMTPEETTFTNYWFRHVWEFAWPLYIGLLLSADILDIALRDEVLRLLPLTLSAIIFGWVLEIRKYGGTSVKLDMESRASGRMDKLKELMLVLQMSWPIWMIILLFLLAELPLLPVIFLVVTVYLVLAKLSRQDLVSLVKRSFDSRILLVGLGVLVFARMLEDTKALDILKLFNTGMEPVPFPL